MGQVYQVWSGQLAARVKCTRCGVGQLAAWVKCTRCGVGQRHGSSVPGVELVSGMGQVCQLWSWSAAWVKCTRCGVGQLAAWVKCTRCGVGQRHGSSVPGVELVSGMGQVYQVWSWSASCMGQVYQVWSWSAAWVKCTRCGVGQRHGSSVPGVELVS